MSWSPEALVESFKAINDSASRRAVLTGIMENLRFDEIRELQSHAANWTFQCDVLTKLPCELAALSAQYLELSDLVVLRRVSKRWYALLTSTTVLRAAIRYHTGNNAIKPESAVADLDSLIKKRIRAERGMPAIVAAFPSDLASNEDDEVDGDGIGYFNGVCAWIQKSTENTSIFLVHLLSGKTCKLTTENREKLTQVKLSDTLVSAISIRGYCHVWNILTEEYKRFRIPSMRFIHHVPSGSKVLLSYADSIVHFNYHSGVTRIVQIGTLIVSVSAHPVEDQFSVVCIGNKDDNNQNAECSFWVNPQIQSRRYSARNNEFFCIGEKRQKSPLKRSEVSWLPHLSSENASLYSGTSSTVLTISAGMERYMVFFTLEIDDQITVHHIPEGINLLSRYVNLANSDQSSRLIYCIANIRFGAYFGLCIGSEYPETSRYVCSDSKWVRFEVDCEVDSSENQDWVETVGDGDFVIFFGPYDEILVWSFDETWVPSGIPEINVVDRLF